MGLITCYEAFHARKHKQEFDLFSLDEVDQTFDKIVQLRYSQPFLLSGKCAGIILTAYPSGRSIGGTCWKISKDNDDVLYAVDYNHKKERHLNGTILHLGLDILSRPTLLITDSRNALAVQPTRQPCNTRDTIKKTVLGNGSVMIPVDASIRILELSYLLDKHWSQYNIRIPLFFLSFHGTNTINVAKSMLEWLGDSLTTAFSQRREAPFYFQHLQLLSSLDDLRPFMGKPCVCLVSTNSMDDGFSNDLFFEWSKNDLNVIIFPEKPPQSTLARSLYDKWAESTVNGGTVKLEESIEIALREKVALEGEELEEHLKSLEQQNKAASVLRLDPDEEDDDLQGGDEEDEQDETLNTMLHNQYDFFVKDKVKSSVFFKQEASFFMFPVPDLKRKFDDYGEVIDVEVYLQGEYQNALDKHAQQSGMFVGTSDAETKLERFTQDSPFKYSESQIQVVVKCQLLYIDFEGRSDATSIKNIIQQVQPRKLILIHGSSEATSELLQYCTEHENITNEVFAPVQGQLVTISEAKNMVQVKLTDSLMSSLDIKPMRDYQVAFVNGLIRYTDSNEQASVPSLDILPASQQQLKSPVILGDLKLAEFRRLLSKEGFQTQFFQGVLILPEQGVIIRKSSTGRLSMEGKLSKEYFQIRKLMYSQHVLL